MENNLGKNALGARLMALTSKSVVAGAMFVGISPLFLVGLFSNQSPALLASGCAGVSCSSDESAAVSSDVPRVLSVVVGETYKFGTFVPAGATPEWSAMLGRMTPDGTYTAPNYMPPGAWDQITYQDSEDNFVHLDIHLRPNPNKPEMNYPKFIRKTNDTIVRDGIHLPRYELVSGPGQVVTRSGELFELLEDVFLPQLDVGESYQPPMKVINCKPAPTLVPFFSEIKRVPEETISIATPKQEQSLSVRHVGGPAIDASFSWVLVCQATPSNPIPDWAGTECGGPEEPVAPGRSK